MKIACLQFAPEVGDVDNNIDRADAVLAKANADDLDGLDLLVLPELAFTGYNFRSLQEIFPFLEDAGDGVTSLWAQATALKYDCTVVVGYPEKVDVTEKWPTSPEYYSSVVVINRDGDAIVNYRKSFLYYTDETWALEGGDGFFQGRIPGLGNVALGICTDLNPYKLEAPWGAFEFGFHILEAQANVVVLTMAWQTHQDLALFSRRPEQPDLQTLVYWVQRLEPLIRAEKEEEVIVVFCNRSGAEDEAMYTGTSAVIGIKRGEVFVYGVLGRGVSDLLVVDTGRPPKSKLANADGVEAGYYLAEQTDSYTDRRLVSDCSQTNNAMPDKILLEKDGVDKLADHRTEVGHATPRSPASPRLPWLAPSGRPGDIPTDCRSPTRLQIPTRPHINEYISMDGTITGDTVIDSPDSADLPNSIRRPPGPKLAIPSSPWRFPRKHSPYAWHCHDGSHSSVFGGGATMTPITPLDEEVWTATPIDPAPPQWYWRHEPTLSALDERIREEEEGQCQSSGHHNQGYAQKGDRVLSEPQPRKVSDFEADGNMTEEGMDAPERAPGRAPFSKDCDNLIGAVGELSVRLGSGFDNRAPSADTLGSPNSRNLSRDTSRYRRFQASEVAYGCRRSESDSSDGTSNGSSTQSLDLKQPQLASASAVNPKNDDNQDVARCPPPRSRQAQFTASEPDDGPGRGRASDQPNLDEHRPRHVSRGRQPGPRGTSAERSRSVQRAGSYIPEPVNLYYGGTEEDSETPYDHGVLRERHPLPLSLETGAVSRGTVSPGLCSATTASTFDGNAGPITPKAGAFAPEPVILRDYCLPDHAGKLSSAAVKKNGTRDLWLESQARETSYVGADSP
ncbi:hypothetical protein VTK56DRAFT_7142 [Thermocarpiscus australiensis]